MSEAGKSLPGMTPGQIEEVSFTNGYKLAVKDQKIYFIEPDGLGNAAPVDAHFVLELIVTLKSEQESILAALEETQHLLKDHGPQGRNYTNEQYVTLQQALAVQEDTIKFLDSKLVEAQQTIARQWEALEQIAHPRHSYHSEAISTARAALGNKEQGTLTFPNCPICNSNNTLAHPNKARTWLCVPCDKVFEDGDQS
jgi:uncharacterized coiled-coil protein SlyX